MMIRTAPACAATLSLLLSAIPTVVEAGECPLSTSEIATDRPDVTNSSIVVPPGSLQGENGINSTGHAIEKTFDGTNSRLRLGVAPCFELWSICQAMSGDFKGRRTVDFPMSFQPSNGNSADFRSNGIYR
jgi:hypothetical protein